MRTLVGSLDGQTILRAERRGPRSGAAEIGVALAEELLAAGADAILKEIFAA